ncbi:MAG: methylated-DNA--[protein]-cysteine S-methyltransferase [Candidatus Aquicultor sp.]
MTRSELLGFTTYTTQWGVGAAVFSGIGLAGIIFPQESEHLLEEEIARRYDRLKYDETLGLELSSTIGRYFNGENVHFDYQLDYGQATEFERKIYDTLKSVSYGETLTYKELALRCGRPKAARAVGNAMAKNPVPIVVPCHRVLKSDGSIGGWSGKRGWKERLLALEGILPEG